MGKSTNRREWMKECLRLLESLIEKPDSKPFREPVDCLKFPVSNHLRLMTKSKVFT